jgi:class 3 adenylate cyclase
LRATVEPTAERQLAGRSVGFSAAELDGIENLLVRRLVGVGILYFAFGLVLLLVLLPDPPHETRTRVGFIMAGLASVTFALVVRIAIGSARRRFRETTHWVTAPHPGSFKQRRAVTKLPATMARIVACAGAFCCTLILAASLEYYDLEQVLRSGASVAVIVSGAWLLSLLATERTVGPLLGATIDPSDRDPRLGIVARLASAWGMGAAVPIAGLVLAPDRLGLTAVQWFVLAAGLALSFATILGTARSVTEPLRRLRAVVERVDHGDLDVVVRPSDGGEIGRLQRAVASMVTGLRERDRVQMLFGRHVGTEVARRALEGDDALGGELRLVTALFVDIDESTALAQQVPPDELVVMLNAFYGVVVEVVGVHGGFVNKFAGDAALAIFGAPAEDPEHAASALCAARAISDRIVELQEIFPRLVVGTGVATGMVVAGNVGAADRHEYTVIGDPVNEAARLSDLAQDHPTRILTTAATIAAAGDERSSWCPNGSARLRGRNGETLLFTPRLPPCGTPGARLSTSSNLS